jgi:hypothetical protein
MKAFMGLILTSTFLISQAQATQSNAMSMSVTTGSSNGVVGNLAAANEGKVVNLYTNRKGNLSVTFKYSASGLTSSLSIQGSLVQKTASDIFKLQVLNSSGTYSNVLSTSGTSTLKSFLMALPSGSALNGVVTLRLVSNADSNDLNLDQLVIVDSATSAPTPTPAPAPSPASSPTPTPAPAPAPAGALPAGTSWYWQLQGTINGNIAAKVYDIDLFDNSSSTFASLKQSGHTVICYFSAGTYENWRPDAASFPSAALGSNVSGWAGERWLDVRNQTVRDIMSKRMDLAKSKGCNGLEPDNVDGFANKSGFPLTAQDQINFNSFLADQAHARGMIVALKNSTDLVSSLVNKFDFAVVEECFKYNECGAYSPFIQQNKAVLNAEYSSYSSATCMQAASLKFSTVFYNLNLDGSVYKPCP